MTIILFIVILAVLILVHEFGHFIVSKATNTRVDEFGLGFPPRALRLFRIGETDYTLNWIPFGGFVKIFGETPDEESVSGPDKERSFFHKPKWAQALILVAGVTFNVLFAWVLISIGFMSGMPTPVSDAVSADVRDVRLVVTSVYADSPAGEAGIPSGASILSLLSEEGELSENLTPEAVSSFIEQSAENEINFTYQFGEEVKTVAVIPEYGVAGSQKAIVGITMDRIGILQLPPHKALWEGARLTGEVGVAVTVGLFTFFKDIFIGQADFAQVAGPVGIVGLVGSASDLGFVYLLSFTAFISINLAVINLLPLPALDGGRLVFVAIETIKGSPIKPSVANFLNGIGFILLILLMLVVTFNDIVKLF